MPRFTRSAHLYLRRIGASPAVRRPMAVLSLPGLAARALPAPEVPAEVRRYQDGTPPPDRGPAVRPVA